MSVDADRVARGAGWIYAVRWIERLLEFATLVVLARILAPEDFGLFAIAASVVTIVEGVSDFDVAKALIRTHEEHRDLYDTAWTLALVRGLLAAGVMVGAALVVEDPRIAAILLALASTPVLRGISNPRFVVFERELSYSRVAVQTLGARIAAVATTLAIALVHRTYWALVLGMIAGAAVGTLLGYVLRPYLPRPTLSRSREIFAFSGWMSLTTLVTTLSMETDRIIVGRLLGVAQAGLYFMTQRVGVLPTRELISPLQRILFPSFSRIADDRPRLRRVASESVNVLGSLSLPAGFGFALVASDLVPLVLGDGWLAIAPLLTVFVPFLGVRNTLSMTLPCLMALGRTRLLFRVSFAYACVHVPAFVAGTLLFGLPGAIGGIVVAGVLYTGLNAWMLRRALGITLGEIVNRLRRPLLATGAMVAVVSGATLVLRGPLGPSPSWPVLVAKVGVGAASYGIALYVLWRSEGRPSGVEARLAQALSRRSASSSA